MKEIDLIKDVLSQLGNSNYYLDAFSRIEQKLTLYQKIERTLYDSDLYLVYKHTDPNGLVYIGITRNLPQQRWNDGSGYESQRKFYKAIQKYGWVNFKHEIIDAALTEEEAKELENNLIIKNRSFDPIYGYNTRVTFSAPQEYSQSEQITYLDTHNRTSGK